MSPVLIQSQTFTAGVNTTDDGQLDPSQNAYFALGFGGENSRPIHVSGCHIDGGGTAIWSLKFSKCFDGLIEDCVVVGGTERALDMVRGGNVTFKNVQFQNGGHRPRITSRFDLRSAGDDIGLKGGVRDITFDSCSMNDLWLGDYSIYDQIDRPKTRRIRLINCVNPNGGPIIVRGLYADKIETVNTQVSQWTWPAPLVWLYWKYERRFGDKRVITPDEFVIDPEELV